MTYGLGSSWCPRDGAKESGHKDLTRGVLPPKVFLLLFLQEGIAVCSMLKTVKAGSGEMPCAQTGIFHFPGSRKPPRSQGIVIDINT